MLFAQNADPLSSAPHAQWFLFGSVVGGVLMWGVEMWRHREEVLKLRAEVSGLKSENLLRVQETRRQYTDAHDALTPLMTAVFTAIRADALPDALDAARESACRHFFSQVLTRYVDYVEMHCHVEFSAPDERSRFIDDEVIPELRRFQSWTSILNYPEMLQRLPHRGPAKVERRTLLPLRRIAKGVDAALHTEYYARLDEVIAAILAAGADPVSDAA